MAVDDESLNVRILSMETVAADTVCLTLVSLDGEPMPAFVAGAHIDVHVCPGLVRQYSLVNIPSTAPNNYRIGVLREPNSRGGSRTIHSDFRPGQMVRIGKPRCNFPLAPNAKFSYLIAGGIGITPMISMALHLTAENKEFVLHYCCRSRDRAAFLNELRSSGFASHVEFHCDEDGLEGRFDPDRHLTELGPDNHVYICGPAGFIDFVAERAASAGWSQAQVHIERFKADVSTAGGEFTVCARKSGVEVRVKQNQTIAQALASIGVAVLLSCEQGVCGTCLTRVIEGQPDHRDSYQTDDEKDASDRITPCCSRSFSERIVLDL